jgi:hypothetical protein
VQATLVTFGIVFVAAAIVGGGLKAAGNEIPIISSKFRQVFLAVFGGGLLLLGLLVLDSDGVNGDAQDTATAATTTLSVTPTALSVTPTTLSVTTTALSVTPTALSVTTTALSVTPTALSVTTTALSVTPTTLSVTLLASTFDDLNPFDPTRVIPFLSSQPIGYTAHPAFAGWEVDDRGRGRDGGYAVNVIPIGNVDVVGGNALSAARLNRSFDVSSYDTITLRFWVNSTSNPSVALVHNCESWLDIYFRTDSGDWTHKTALCGSHQTESSGWYEVSLSFDVRGRSDVEFFFEYGLQDTGGNEANGNVYYLIDDLQVLAE